MKKYLIIICTFFSVFQCFSQEKFEIKRLGFSINVPKNWIEMKNDETLKNIDRIDFTDKQLDEILKSANSSVSFVTYTKYDPKTHQGIIPTIKITARESKSKTIQSFLKAVESSTKEAGKSLGNFNFTEQPVVIKISNKEAVKFAIRFTIKASGKEYEIMSHSYYILLNGYYISVNFLEETVKEDNSKLVDDLVNSIQITK